MGGAFGVLGDWRDSVSLPEGGEGGKLGLRGEACLEPGKQEEVREIFRRRRETPAGEKVCDIANPCAAYREGEITGFGVNTQDNLPPSPE